MAVQTRDRLARGFLPCLDVDVGDPTAEALDFGPCEGVHRSPVRRYSTVTSIGRGCRASPAVIDSCARAVISINAPSAPPCRAG